MRQLAAWLILPALLAAEPAVSEETILQLGHSTTIAVPPDELLALLRIEAGAASASDAQARVNTIARAASAAADPVQQVRFATIGYHVTRNPGPPARWRASQTIRLASGDGAALLSLVGVLQQKGLAVTAIQWRLTPDTESKARQSATRDVLKALMDRTTDAAEALGMTFSHFRAIQLDAEDPNGPAQRATAMGQAPEPGPVVRTDDVVITATVQVEAVLVSR